MYFGLRKRKTEKQNETKQIKLKIFFLPFFHKRIYTEHAKANAKRQKITTRRIINNNAHLVETSFVCVRVLHTGSQSQSKSNNNFFTFCFSEAFFS